MQRLVVAAFLLGCSGNSSDIAPTSDATAETLVADTASPTDTTAPETTSTSDTAVDTAKPDVANPDVGKPDVGKPDVGKPDTGAQCLDGTGCRKFSSYCSTAPCVCIPLKADAADPKCDGDVVTCFIDPCNGKTAACVDGACAIK